MNKEIFSDLLAKSSIKNIGGDLPSSNPDSADGNKSMVWYFNDKVGQKWVIKQYPEWINEADISWIHNYMGELTQRQFPIAGFEGIPLQFDRRFYAIYSYAHGHRYNSENQAHLIDMSLKLGELHSLSKNIKINGSRNWPVVANFKYQGNNKFLTHVWQVAAGLLENNTNTLMPIHGDFRKDNIRFNDNGISKIFDFGNARNDYPEVDLAITLRDISQGLQLSDLLNIQSEFLQIYSNLGTRLPRIYPNLIFASAVILGIQESTYLLGDYSKNKNKKTKTSIDNEIKNLNFLLQNFTEYTSLYKSIFS